MNYSEAEIRHHLFSKIFYVSVIFCEHYTHYSLYKKFAILVGINENY